MAAPSARTRFRRVPKRGTHERRQVEAILDEAIVCHVGLVDAEGFPVTIPTLCARDGERLLIHGSPASRVVRRLAEDGAEACVTATLVDGIVLARSAFHHSVNYRSVVVFGRAEPIGGEAEKTAALAAFVEKLAPGRWAAARRPSPREMKGTTILALALDEASAKVRSGPPLDEDEDYALPVWAGTIPLRTVAGDPVPDPRQHPEAVLASVPVPPGAVAAAP